MTQGFIMRILPTNILCNNYMWIIYLYNVSIVWTCTSMCQYFWNDKINTSQAYLTLIFYFFSMISEKFNVFELQSMLMILILPWAWRSQHHFECIDPLTMCYLVPPEDSNDLTNLLLGKMASVNTWKLWAFRNFGLRDSQVLSFWWLIPGYICLVIFRNRAFDFFEAPSGYWW